MNDQQIMLALAQGAAAQLARDLARERNDHATTRANLAATIDERNTLRDKYAMLNMIADNLHANLAKTVPELAAERVARASDEAGTGEGVPRTEST